MPLEGLWRETYWTSADLVQGAWPGKPVSVAVNEILDQLASHREFLCSVRDSGGTSELFVGWFFDGQSGDVFDCQLMGRMAEPSLDLSLDYYPPDQPQASF